MSGAARACKAVGEGYRPLRTRTGTPDEGQRVEREINGRIQWCEGGDEGPRVERESNGRIQWSEGVTGMAVS